MDYQAVTEEAQKENKTVQTFETEDGEGNVVKVAACCFWRSHGLSGSDGRGAERK